MAFASTTCAIRLPALAREPQWDCRSGRLLGHSQAQTTARYSHLHADPLRRAADTIGSQISAAMAGRTAEVVPLKKFS
jgi:hypothetical protein